mgnify:CR=1 FL=1
MKKKKSLTLLYIALNILIILLIGIFDPYISDIGQLLNRINYLWLLGGIGAMALYWVMDAWILQYAVAGIYRRESLAKAFKVALIGQYYNAVTPFASGGQPFQIYYMKKYGIPVGFGSSSLMIKFLIYQIALSIYCLLAFVFRAGFILSQPLLFFVFSLIGFLINGGAVFFIYAFSVSKRMIRGVILAILKLLHRIRLIKDLDEAWERIQEHVEDFQRSIHMVQGNYAAMMKMGLMTFFQLTCYFSITYFIYRAFGLNEASCLDIVFVQAFLYLAVSFFPTPGATGASEFGFYGFFQIFFNKNIIFIAMLLWRLITYYMNVAAGSLIILFEGIGQIFKKSE